MLIALPVIAQEVTSTDAVVPPAVVVLVTGALAPFIIGAIKKKVTSENARFFIALGITTVMGWHNVKAVFILAFEGLYNIPQKDTQRCLTGSGR